MKKILTILFAFLFVTSTAMAYSGTLVSPEAEPKTVVVSMFDRIQDYTVSLVMVGEGLGTCSGTMVYEDQEAQYIITAKHCVEGALEVYVENNMAYRWQTSLEDDMALITLKEKIYTKIPANLAYRPLRKGDKTYLIGYPSTVRYTTQGTMILKTRDWVIYDMKVIPGCSGGGIFNDYGQLVGVIWGAYINVERENPMKSLGEGIEDVRTFLRKVLPQAIK